MSRWSARGRTWWGWLFQARLCWTAAGRVTARFFEDFSNIDRNTVSSLLVKLGGATGASVAGTKISGNHLDVTTYSSDREVAPGNRFALVLDVQPHPRIHVYAPGAEKLHYRVISLQLDSNAQIQTLPMHYPASEIYYFKPLKERAPVYQKPFQLVQELVLQGTPAAQEALRGKTELTIAGTLQYQACDDKTCYNPVSLPLTWKLGLRSLVRERPTPAK